MTDLGWIMTGAGLLVGAGAMWGWVQWHKVPALPVVANRMVAASMTPEAALAYGEGDPPTVVQIKVGDEVIYKGPVKEAKIIRRRLKMEGKNARLIDEFGRDRG